MLNLTTQGQTLVAELAGKYGVSQDAVTTVMQALIRGTGRAAQFSHPDFGGHCQWMAGGMTMTPDLFNHALKARVDGLCTDLAAALSAPAAGEAGAGLYVPDASRSTGHWWPFSLGSPAAAGSQNNVSYALFPEARRLAVEIKGHVTTYDLGDYQVSGLAQQQGGDSTLTFITQKGLLGLADLPIVGTDAGTPHTLSGPAEAVPIGEASHSVALSNDILGTIERLAGLKDRGILTPEEFAAKKAELLGRL